MAEEDKDEELSCVDHVPLTETENGIVMCTVKESLGHCTYKDNIE